MICSRIQPNLADYSLGRLTQSENKIIEEHLLVCEECRQVLDEERELCLRLAETAQVSPANDVWALVRSQTRPRAGVFELLRSRAAKLTAAAALTAVTALALVSMQPNKTEVDRESINAVTAIMLQPERNVDDPLGSNYDALLAAIDEGT